jgi:hypothetical protein
MFTTELQGYEKALAAEMRRQGVGLQPIAGDQLALVGNGEAPPISKAHFARQYIQDHAAMGVTPNQLFEGFIAAKIQIKKPYIYSLIMRLQAQKSIVPRRGKYYPAATSGGESGNRTEG